jgi:hypothetical protein
VDHRHRLVQVLPGESPPLSPTGVNRSPASLVCAGGTSIVADLVGLALIVAFLVAMVALPSWLTVWAIRRRFGGPRRAAGRRRRTHH